MADHLRATTEILLGSKVLFADSEPTVRKRDAASGGF